MVLVSKSAELFVFHTDLIMYVHGTEERDTQQLLEPGLLSKKSRVFVGNENARTDPQTKSSGQIGPAS